MQGDFFWSAKVLYMRPPGERDEFKDPGEVLAGAAAGIGRFLGSVATGAVKGLGNLGGEPTSRAVSRSESHQPKPRQPRKTWSRQGVIT